MLLDYLFEFSERERDHSTEKTAAEGVLQQIDKLREKGISSRSALNAYWNRCSKSLPFDNEPIIFPFGCNGSQKKAVEKALTNQLSLIEGPPGTGKTQTILNIIANLLIRQKTIAVCSNNNSATKNVKEKLDDSKWQLGWLVAELGNSQLKESFFKNLPELKIDPNWKSYTPDVKRLKELSQWVEIYYDKQRYEQQLKDELYKLTRQRAIFLEESKNYKKASQTSNWVSTLSQKNSIQLDQIEKYARQLLKDQWWSRWIATIALFFHGIHQCKNLLNEIDGFLDLLVCIRADKKIEECQHLLALTQDWLIKHKQYENQLIELSKQYLFSKIYRIYHRWKNWTFKVERFRNSEGFYKRYPIITSSTHSLKYCTSFKDLFDYVIVDEASQVSLPTGVLCLSCAKNAVIVGDRKQLPMIVNTKECELKYQIDPVFDATKNSLLDSIRLALGKDLQSTLLREHYRCQPDIIEFCNQRFYGGELIIMSPRKEDLVFEWIQMSPSHLSIDEYENGSSIYSLRQVIETKNKIEELIQEGIISKDIGVIAPYRLHAEKIMNCKLDSIVADTVHKFQGRELPVILFNVVSNDLNDFVDDSNLINVAVSRAKQRFILISTVIEQKDSNLGALMAYINYLDPKMRRITQSQYRSIFDCLYQHKKVLNDLSPSNTTESPAETIFRELLQNELKKLPNCSWSFVQEYPLRLLVQGYKEFDSEEVLFMRNGARLDFLLYDTMNRQPLGAIEVDGATYHQVGSRQMQRDKLKDHILDSMRLPHIRFRTNSAVGNEEQKLAQFLESIYTNRNPQSKKESTHPTKYIRYKSYE